MKNRNLLLILLMGLSLALNAQTVTIGTQVWMTKNLDVATFRNGDPIPQAKTEEEWEKAGKNKQPAWCYYENDPANGAKYGKLYNWYAVNDSRGLAPIGYHVPSNPEWTELVFFLGTDAGKKMKSTSGWDEDGNGTNSSGFSGLPGGWRSNLGTFNGIGEEGEWWSSMDMFEPDKASYLELDNYSLNYVYMGTDNKEKGLYVRCLRDYSSSGGNVTKESSSANDPSSNEVTIGSQVWMTKNLDVATFRNGDPIPHAKTNEEWAKATINRQPAWCYYDNDPANGAKYGKLYNWYAVNDPRGLAPVGYHIPSDTEWTILFDFLGDWRTAGTKMKSTSGWEGHGNGSNTSGFSGLPGGSRGIDGTFSFISYRSFWWSSTACFSGKRHGTCASFCWLGYWSGNVQRVESGRLNGMSVRCLRD